MGHLGKNGPIQIGSWPLENDMAWNDPPGKQPGKKGARGPQPAALDDWMRDVGQRVQRFFSGGSQSGGGTAWLVLGLVLLTLAISSVNTIDAGEQGVVQRFGRFDRVQQPGLNFHLPLAETVHRVNIAEVRTVKVRGAMLTRDENIIDLELVIQYKVKSAPDYVFKVAGPDVTIRHAAESAVREVVGKNTMDHILREGRSEVSVLTEELLQKVLDSYRTGLEVTSANLQDIRPPADVKAAFDDAIKAREDKLKYENEAQAYFNNLIPRSRGRAARERAKAEADKASAIANAEGATQRFSMLLKQYRLAPEVTRQRLYLETVEDVMRGSGKVLLDSKAGNNVIYLPLDQMLKSGRGRSSNSLLDQGVKAAPRSSQPGNTERRPGRSKRH